MNRYLLSLGLASLLQGSEPPTPAYEAVLRYLREQHPSRVIVLNTNIANLSCLERCEGPMVTGTHPAEWLIRARHSRVIDDTCTPRPSDQVCIRRETGTPTSMEQGMEVLLSNARPWEDGAMEVAASFHTTNAAGRVYGETIRYIAARRGDRWSVVSARTVEYIN